MKRANRGAKELADQLAAKSIVTKALGRYLLQVVTAIHEESVQPLEKENAALRAEVAKLKAELTELQFELGELQAGSAPHQDAPKPVRAPVRKEKPR